MIIVGELLNTTRSAVARAVRDRDEAFVRRTARLQADAGADFIDVNAGTLLEDEAAALCWMAETVAREVDRPLCLDSSSPDALARALDRVGGEPMINSISLEPGRLGPMLPLVTSRPLHVVGLCMAENAMPVTAAERLSAATELLGRLTDAGLPPERIYLDPLFQPVSVDTSQGAAALEAMEAVRRHEPRVQIMAGLSNISFGLPLRRLLNRTFLALALDRGLTAALCDPTDRALVSTLRAAETLLGRDEYCERYLDDYQAGTLEG